MNPRDARKMCATIGAKLLIILDYWVVNYLKDVFGWERGNEYFNKWNDVPVQLRANRVRWRTDGQRMRNGFNSASGADPNKYTDKYSNPGSYQGRRRKREAEAEPQYLAT